MEFSKNQSLINNICLVQIKSLSNVVDISTFTDFYNTPSKITLTKQSRFTEAGALHSKRLSLSFPGLSDADFEKFHKLIQGEYLILIKLDTNDIYDLTTKRYPFDCSTSFNKNHTITFTSDSPFPIKFRENQSSGGIDDYGFNYDFNFYLS